MNRSHDCKFLPDRPLAKLDDTNLLILEALDLRSLRQLAQTNHYFNNLVHSNVFWGKRVRDTYGERIVQLKPSVLTFEQQYFHLLNFGVDKAMRLGRLDILYHRIHSEQFPTEISIIDAMSDGDLQSLSFVSKFMNLSLIIYDFHIHEIIIKNGHLHILQWLHEKGCKFTSKDVDLAILYRMGKIYNWFISLNISPSANGINHTLSNGDTKLFEHFANKPDPILPTATGAGIALIRGHKGVVEYLIKKNIRPPVVYVDVVAKNGSLVRLQYLSELDPPILPSRSSADYAIINDMFDVFDWLIQKRIYPTQESCIELSAKGDLDKLKILADKGKVRISRKSAAIAAENGHLHVIKWMTERKSPVYPNEHGLAAACLHKRYDVVEFLFTCGIYPSRNGCDNLAYNGQLDLLAKLVEVNVRPTNFSANVAAERGDTVVVKWLGNMSPPIYPTTKASVKRAIVKCGVELFEYLSVIVPDLMPSKITNAFAERIAGHDNIELFEHLSKRLPKLFLTRTIANAALGGRAVRILDYLKSKQIYPNVSQVSKLSFVNDLKTLKWMKENLETIPSADAMRFALFSSNIILLNWLVQNEVYPTQKDLSKMAARGVLSSLKWAAALPSPIYPEFPTGIVKTANLETIQWLHEHKLIDPLKMLVHMEYAEWNFRDSRLKTMEWLIQQLPIASFQIKHFLKHIQSSRCRRQVLSSIKPN